MMILVKVFLKFYHIDDIWDTFDANLSQYFEFFQQSIPFYCMLGTSRTFFFVFSGPNSEIVKSHSCLSSLILPLCLKASQSLSWFHEEEKRSPENMGTLFLSANNPHFSPSNKLMPSTLCLTIILNVRSFNLLDFFFDLFFNSFKLFLNQKRSLIWFSEFEINMNSWFILYKFIFSLYVLNLCINHMVIWEGNQQWWQSRCSLVLIDWRWFISLLGR